MLYQVAVMQRKRKKKDKEKLIWMSDWIIADDPQQAGMKACMENRDEIKCDFDDMEILVRPFL
jgi:hypothetical protein